MAKEVRMMSQYTLTEQDIRVLIGAAADEFCEENYFSEEDDDSVINIAAEISCRVCEHLSGKKKFSEEIMTLLQALDDRLIENAPIAEAATSGRINKNSTIF